MYYLVPIKMPIALRRGIRPLWNPARICNVSPSDPSRLFSASHPCVFVSHQGWPDWSPFRASGDIPLSHKGRGRAVLPCAHGTSTVSLCAFARCATRGITSVMFAHAGETVSRLCPQETNRPPLYPYTERGAKPAGLVSDRGTAHLNRCSRASR